MSDSPDYNQVAFVPFPADPSAYTSLNYAAQLAQGVAHTLATLSDSKLYVLKYVQVAGTMVNVSSTTADTGDVQVGVNRGLNDAGTPFQFVEAFCRLNKTGVSGDAAVVEYYLSFDGPMIIRAGTVGSPNLLSVGFSCSLASSFALVAVTGAIWPLN